MDAGCFKPYISPGNTPGSFTYPPAPPSVMTVQESLADSTPPKKRGVRFALCDQLRIEIGDLKTDMEVKHTESLTVIFYAAGVLRRDLKRAPPKMGTKHIEKPEQIIEIRFLKTMHEKKQKIPSDMAKTNYASLVKKKTKYYQERDEGFLRRVDIAIHQYAVIIKRNKKSAKSTG